MNSKNRKLLQKNTLMYREAEIFLKNYLQDDRQKSEIPPKYLWQLPAKSFIPLGRNRGIMVGLNGAVEGHLAIIGGTGDGKSTTIKHILLMWLYSLVCTDPKGELSRLYLKMYKYGMVTRPAIVFNPNAPDGPHFDPFDIIRQNPNDMHLLIREIVHTLLPSVFDASESFWRPSAQGVLEAALLFYYKLGYSFIDAIQDILRLTLSALCCQIKTVDPESYTKIGQIGDTDNKTLAIIDREIRNAISVFEDPKIAAAFSQDSGKTFSWQDIEKYNIFLSIPDEMIESWGAAFNILYSQLFYLLAKRPEKYSKQSKNLPVLIIMDEFARMGKLEAVEHAISTLRSKSVNLLFSLQSLAQLDRIYGTCVRRIILDNCNYKLILGARDAETQQMLADLTGTFLSSSISTSASRGVDSKINYSFTESQMREYSKNPHEFGFLQDKAVCHTPHGNYVITKCRMSDLPQIAAYIKKHRKKKEGYIMEMNSSNESALRYLMGIREDNQMVRKQKCVLEKRREYIVGQIVLGAIPELPECIPGSDEDNRKRFVLFERFIRCMSLSKRLHAYLANTLGDTDTTSPESVKASAKLVVNLFYKKLDSRVAFTDSASVSMDTTVSEPAIITKTQSLNLERRRQRMVGRILLDSFPEIPPLVKGTNEEYLSQIIAFRYLIHELGTRSLTHKMISSCWCIKGRRR